MHLFMFADAKGQSRFGIETPIGNVDVCAARPDLPATLQAFVASGGQTSDLREIADDPNPAHIVTGALRRLPPIGAPSKILCIGLNYADHAGEMNTHAPLVPEVFAKFPSTLVGDGAYVLIPQQSDAFDYEAELAVIIGRKAYQVSEHDALSHVFGYMPFNDFTVRDIQMRSMQWTLGKNFDTHGACGPCVVTTDEIPNPQALDIRLNVDGITFQSANTRDMIFSCARLIELLSSVMTLEPGDIIATGTPSGVGAAKQPPQWLHEGQTVTVEIETVGILTNVVRRQHLT